MSHTDPAKRHEFVLLFEVTNGNPNGDPDAGNLPRIDPQTMHGLMTDVALKRKVRDYLQMTWDTPIFIQSKVALNTLIHGAFQEAGVEPIQVALTEEELEDEALMQHLASKEESGFLMEEGNLIYSGESLKKKDIEKAITGGVDNGDQSLGKKLKALAKRIDETGRANGGTAITQETRNGARNILCRKYFDIRMFGAVLATGLNAGQVRGPAQITFARSINRVFPLDLTITRQARTTKERMKTGTTEMGRKPLIPYGLYRAHGYFNPYLATGKTGTGVVEEDMVAFWEALEHLFDFDRSAARGEMNVRGLYVFTHENKKGDAPAHLLFELVQVKQNDADIPARGFGDFTVTVPAAGPLADFPRVSMERIVG